MDGIRRALLLGTLTPAEGRSDPGEPLYLQKHRIRSGEQTIKVTVRRAPMLAGIDPYYLLDWEQRASVEPVKTERKGLHPIGAR